MWPPRCSNCPPTCGVNHTLPRRHDDSITTRGMHPRAVPRATRDAESPQSVANDTNPPRARRVDPDTHHFIVRRLLPLKANFSISWHIAVLHGQCCKTGGVFTPQMQTIKQRSPPATHPRNRDHFREAGSITAVMRIVQRKSGRSSVVGCQNCRALRSDAR